MGNRSSNFYNEQWRSPEYRTAETPVHHEAFTIVRSFVTGLGLHNKRCLEIGTGKGFFQEFVSDYFGIDLAHVVGPYFSKPFVCGSADALPFPDDSFDAIWTIFVLEHIPNLEKAFAEIRRVLKNNGFLLLWPAWYCRPWRAEGYEVRPYSDFGITGKFIKASIPLRDSLMFRASYVMPRRLIRLISFMLNDRPVRLKYRSLKPNLDTFWLSDSDACNSIDPFDAMLWFISRGDRCLSSAGSLNTLLVRTGPLTIKIRKKGRDTF